MGIKVPSALAVFFFATLTQAAPPILGSPQAKKGGNFRYNILVSPQTLNPITAHDGYAVRVRPWMSESLLEHHVDTYEWLPLLAKSYTIAPDKKSVRFELRQGVKFHDGSDLTADDVKFSLDIYRRDTGTGLESQILSNVEAVEIPDSQSVIVRFKKALFSNLQLVASLPIVPKKIYSDKEKASLLNRTVVGTGPYRFKEYTPGQRLILEKNPNWWGKNLPRFKYKFNFDQITVRFVNEVIPSLQMIKAGELDYRSLSFLTPNEYLKEDPQGKLKIVKIQNYSVYTSGMNIYWNLRLPLFKSKKVRRALQLLLNRKLMNEKTMGSPSLFTTGPWHRLSEYADPSLPEVGFDPVEAQRLLKSDGWSDTNGDGVLDKVIDGKRVDFRINLSFATSDHDQILSLYQYELKKAGIQLGLQRMEWATLLTKLQELKFEAYLVGRGNPGLIDFNPRLDWHSEMIDKTDSNDVAYSNPKLDRILETAEAEFDRKKRIQLLRKAYRLIAEDQVFLFLFSDPATYLAISPRIRYQKPSYRYVVGIDYWWME
ncbi:hypothetical protein K2X30_02180 [bacterium]|jgi:peptide/nickel transport system substrate-binding protein/microcin C transport system substrate-binding protein|nr:hypothetical protein [bacterium]